MLAEKIFEKYINNFYNYMTKNESHRYKSWEYCYKFFQDNKEELKRKNDSITDLAALHLAFYLASWGMYRGSSFLLQKDYTIHKGAVEIISDYYDLADIDIKDWASEHTKNLFTLKDKLNKHYNAIRKIDVPESFKGPCKKNISYTLITKILLGTLGITPAYDRYFKNGLTLYNNVCTSEKISAAEILFKFDENNFQKLIEFVKQYKDIFEKINLTLAIDSAKQYPFMKKVDMFFWNLGRPWAIWDEINQKYITENKKPIEENNQYINYFSKDGKLDCFEAYIEVQKQQKAERL